MRVAATCLLLFGSSLAFAGVNRCAQADGRVIYTEAACPAATERATQVPGTTSSPAFDAERQRLRNSERDDLQLQGERIALERQKIQLERERLALKQQQRWDEQRQNELPAGYGAVIPAGPHSHACGVAARNLGVGAGAASRRRSQREYELACFGSP